MYIFSFGSYSNPLGEGKEGVLSSIGKIRKSRPRSACLTGSLVTGQGQEKMSLTLIHYFLAPNFRII